jgi:hypothetical protein
MCARASKSAGGGNRRVSVKTDWMVVLLVVSACLSAMTCNPFDSSGDSSCLEFFVFFFRT